MLLRCCVVVVCREVRRHWARLARYSRADLYPESTRFVLRQSRSTSPFYRLFRETANDGLLLGCYPFLLLDCLATGPYFQHLLHVSFMDLLCTSLNNCWNSVSIGYIWLANHRQGQVCHIYFLSDEETVVFHTRRAFFRRKVEPLCSSGLGPETSNAPSSLRTARHR